MSREHEAHLFRKMNYLKCRANQLGEQLDPDRPNPADLDEIELLRRKALTVQNRLVEMYVRLVVSIANRRARVGYDLCECVSDGNLAGLDSGSRLLRFRQGQSFPAPTPPG